MGFYSTIRGWREADITGIEHHFNEKEAVTAQKPVKKLVFNDTKIGKRFGFICFNLFLMCYRTKYLYTGVEFACPHSGRM